MRASSLDLAGPSGEPGYASPADRAACRAAIRTGSRSFYAASALLPRKVREPAFGLYAFCRLSDDAVDDATGADRGRAAARLAQRLDRACAGRPADHPADRAFADLMATHAIPRALPEALIDGLAWDAQDRRYATLSELCTYAARVAASVGAMMTLIMGVRDPGVLARACDLGVAMQLTNIARDVGEDARMGRLYLPRTWLDEAGIDPRGFLAAPAPSAALRAVVARLLAAADLLYARAQPGIAGLPLPCRPAIRAAGLIYGEIGRAVEANGHDSVSRRARVSGARKAALLARALAGGGSAEAADAPALPEVAFLIDAVCAHPAPTLATRPAWWDVSGQAVRVLDLIEVLQERESGARQGLT